MIGIYKITSPTGRIYIGQSWNIKTRISGYAQPNYKSSQHKLCRSLKKYRFVNHIVEILTTFPVDVTQEVIDEYEIFYIAQHKEGKCKMLNIKEGGSKGKNSPETRKKISIARKNCKTIRILSSEHVEAIKLHNKGKKHTPEARENMSKGQKAIGHLNSLRISKPVLQYTKEGIFIKEWSSLTVASQGIGLKAPGSICVSANSNYRLAGGFRWEYKDIPEKTLKYDDREWIKENSAKIMLYRKLKNITI